MSLAPPKTFIGRIERGFDFLGYHFSPEGLSVAKETLKRFCSRAARLYEQEPGELCDSSRLGVYVKRWLRWVAGGVTGKVARLQLYDATTHTRPS